MGKHIKFDWAMKRMLRNKANFAILEGFLSELLMFDIKIEEILESESNKAHELDKFNRVDILVKDNEENYMLIEVQNESQNDYFHRMHYGQAKLISEHLAESEEYGKLTRIYSINIVYFPLGVGEDYIYVSDGSFRGLHLNDELQLSPKQKELYKVEQVKELFTQYYIIKVNQFNDVAKNTLDEWIYFLKNNEIKEEFKAKGLVQAKERLRIDNLSRDEKIAYDIFVKNNRIRNSEIRTAITNSEYKYEKEKAKRKKAEQREKAAKQKLALKMIKYGEPIEEIIKETKLTEEEIEGLSIDE